MSRHKKMKQLCSMALHIHRFIASNCRILLKFVKLSRVWLAFPNHVILMPIVNLILKTFPPSVWRDVPITKLNPFPIPFQEPFRIILGLLKHALHLSHPHYKKLLMQSYGSVPVAYLWVSKLQNTKNFLVYFHKQY